MATDNKGMEITIPSSQIPDGALLPSFETFNDAEYQTVKAQFTIDKASVEDADPTNTFNTLIAFIDTAIEGKLINDFDDTANTVTFYSQLRSLTNNYADITATGDWYTTNAVNYIADVNIFIKIS